MATVTVPRRDVTQEQVLAALRDQLGSGCSIEPQGGDTVKVKTSVFSHAKVRIEPGGGSGTVLSISPFAVGPLGYLVTTLGISKRVARALQEAPQLREAG
jgi:hypothetical protein